MHPRFARRVVLNPENGCLEWTLSKDTQGYGRIKYMGKRRIAHRISYEVHIGEIPEGMTVDHICFNIACVNPDHLQLLTHSENAKKQRSALSETCARGHVFDAENTYIRPGYGNGKRHCRKCNAAASRRYKQRKVSALNRVKDLPA